MTVHIGRDEQFSRASTTREGIASALGTLTGPTLEAVFAASSVAMMVTTTAGMVLAANVAAGELFGCRCGDLVGMGLDALFVDDVAALRDLIGTLDTLAVDPVSLHHPVELRGLHGDGHRFAVDVTATPVPGSADGPVFLVIRRLSNSLTTDMVEAAYRVASQDIACFQRDLLVEMVRGNGTRGIASALHQKTGCDVAVFDPAGQVLATAGYRSGAPVDRDHRDPGGHHAVHGVRERRGDHWIVEACPDRVPLGSISVHDPLGTMAEADLLVLEQAASILAAERLRSIGNPTEDVLSPTDLARELVDGCDPSRLHAHAEQLGFDLQRTHWVAALEAEGMGSVPVDVVEQVARDAGARAPLVTARFDRTVYIADGGPPGDGLAVALSEAVGARVRIGVGGGHPLADIGGSLAEAVFALELGGNLRCQRSVTHFAELGVWKILVDSSDPDKLHEFVVDWIGPLIEYDEAHGAQLIKTLTAYLEGGCAAEATSSALFVHRNTLRYRLAKISQIIGRDLTDTDDRFQLELACRAWTVVQWLQAA